MPNALCARVSEQNFGSWQCNAKDLRGTVVFAAQLALPALADQTSLFPYIPSINLDIFIIRQQSASMPIYKHLSFFSKAQEHTAPEQTFVSFIK